MKKPMKKIVYSIAAVALCAPLLASAGEAFVVADIGLQAGPDTEYPLIEELSAGTTVSVEGCIAGWTWCDVVVSNGDRGWVPGTFLEEIYGGKGPGHDAAAEVTAMLEGNLFYRREDKKVFLADMGDFASMNEVYATYFP